MDGGVREAFGIATQLPRRRLSPKTIALFGAKPSKAKTRDCVLQKNVKGQHETLSDGLFDNNSVMRIITKVDNNTYRDDLSLASRTGIEPVSPP